MRWFALGLLFLLLSLTSANYNEIELLQNARFEAGKGSGRASPECEAQMDQYFRGLDDKEAWAWNMFDSSPKFPYGILTGNTIDFGNFDQCLRSNFRSSNGNEDVLGKFCFPAMIAIIPVNISMDGNTRITEDITPSLSRLPFTTKDVYAPGVPCEEIFGRSGPVLDAEDSCRQVALGICIPDKCTPMEVYEYFPTLIATVMALNVTIIPNPEPTCKTEETGEEFSNVDIAFVTFLGVILALNVVCSIYDKRTAAAGKEPNPWLLTFSFTSNFRIMHEFGDPSKRITCLDGLRVFSIFWVILGHRFSISQALPWVNADYLDVWKNRAYTQYAQGAGSAVDSFLFLTGLLTAMQFIKSQSRRGAKFNIILYYIHRYLRLTPALAVVYFLHVSVFVHLGDGPLWPSFVLNLKEKCLDRWASFFFYYQNYLDSDGMCLLHTWYLSMDMQIFIASPLVLLPLKYYRKFMIKIGLPILLILSMVCAFVISYVYETQIFSKDYYDYYYYPMHTRLSAWLVGIYAGTLIYEYRNAKLEISTLLNLFIWLVVIVEMICCVFLGNDVTYEYDRLGNAFYLTFHRPAWCIGLAWVVFACMKGRGGIFNWVLSIGIFQNLSRLTYSMYLVHITSLLLGVAKIRFPTQFGDMEGIHLFLGDLIQVVTIALLWYVFFESPMAVLEKLMFGGGKRKPKPTSPPPPSNGIDVKVED